MRYLDKTQGVRVTPDVHYGTARVNISTAPTLRELRLDVYEPEGTPAREGRPALIMAFGGAFHRGNKEADEFDNDGYRNTPVSAYCREFARRGYVAFSIDYRLVQEDPDPGTTHVFGDRLNITRARIDHVRTLLGLPPATSEMLWAGMEAACDDMASAFHFVQANAARYGIDPARIAVGGFSAGARMALSAAYGDRLPAAAVVSLSGYMSTEDLTRLVTGAASEPAAFLVTGDNDLEHIARQAGTMDRHFDTVGVPHETWQALDATHFYPSNSIVVRPDGRRTELEDAMAEFLHAALRLDQLA